MTSPLPPPPSPPGAGSYANFKFSPVGSPYLEPAPPIPKRTTSLNPRQHPRDEQQVPSDIAVTPEEDPNRNSRSHVPAPPRVPKAPVLRIKPHNQDEPQRPRPLPRHRTPQTAQEGQLHNNLPSQSPQQEARNPKFPRPSKTHVPATVPSDRSQASWATTWDSVVGQQDTSIDISSDSNNEQPLSAKLNVSGAYTEIEEKEVEPVPQGVFTLQIDPSVGSEATVSKDPYVGSENVYALNEYNMDTIAFSDDPAMVFFYDPRDDATHATRDQFRKAADSKTVYTHNFGAVNCYHDPEFCKKWEIALPPVIKVFSEGRVVSTIREMKTFDSKAMTGFLDTLVSINQSTASKSNENSTTSKKSKCSLAKMFGFKK